LKKITTLGVAALAAGALTTTAIAQTSPLTATGSASPSKAGTKKKPKATAVKVGFTLPDTQKATLNTITYTFPKTVKLSGKGYKKGAKVGSGTATAFAGVNVDFTFDILVASANKITLDLESQTPGIDVAAKFPGTIKGSKLTVSIPTNVQQPVPGLYSYVTGIQSNLKAKSVTVGKGKKTKKTNFVTTTGCSGGKQTVGISLALTDNGNPQPQNPITGSTDIKCSK
jgi:hypothetical protein